ncbi:hypothetical protein K1719_047431 [Acacia pycnantha]|nr:hypothetical protein K1719_047431 [Acacia pycnantha]
MRNKMDEMVVDEAEAHKKNLEKKERDKGLWKTIQRARRPRRQESSSLNHQTGSRFALLQVEKEDEHVIEKVVNNQGPILSKSDTKKGQSEGIQQKQSNKGKYVGTMGGLKKESEPSKPSNKGQAEQLSRKENDSKEKAPAVGSNLERRNKVLAENYHGYDEAVVVLESNLEPHTWREVQMEGNENLNPGECAHTTRRSLKGT